MDLRTSLEPKGLLFRVGWKPNPLAYPSWEYVGAERFDDPESEYRVLYTGAPRRVAYLETMAQFRPSLRYIAERRVRHAEDVLSASGLAPL